MECWAAVAACYQPLMLCILHVKFIFVEHAIYFSAMFAPTYAKTSLTGLTSSYIKMIVHHRGEKEPSHCFVAFAREFNLIFILDYNFQC